MEVVTQRIQAIVKKLPEAVFLRATDNDANILMDDIDLANSTIVNFNNLPDIDIQIGASGVQSEEWPVEIDFLRLGDIDDNTEDGDAIRKICKQCASDFIGMWIASETENTPSDNYKFAFSERVKIYDNIMTGGRLSFTMYIDNPNGC